MKNILSLLCLLLLPGLAFADSEGFVERPDGRIYYRTYGSGDPILILNGGPGMNSDGFVYLAQKLSAQNKAIIFDQRGTGRSTLHRIDSSTIRIDLMIQDIEALRKALGIRQWVVLGHSFGGLLASQYASEHPRRVRGIIYSASGGLDLDLLNYLQDNIRMRLSRADRDSLQYWSDRIAAGDTSYHARYERAKHLAPAYLQNPSHLPTVAHRLTQTRTEVNALVWDDLRRIRYDCSHQLKRFRKPVLILQGKQDLIEERTARKAEAVLKRSKLVMMDHCGHYGWLDNPEVYFFEIGQFLRNL